MRPSGLIGWKEAPFLRLTPPLIAGIILQFCARFSAFSSWLLISGCALGLLVFQAFPLSRQFSWRAVNGILLFGLLFASGPLLLRYKDIREQPGWFPYHFTEGDTLLATIEEPLVEKERSYRTTISITAIDKGNRMQAVTGRVLLYLQKDSFSCRLQYGNQLRFGKLPGRIGQASNPFAFDYAYYCSLKGLFHQVFLQQKEYLLAEKKQLNPVKTIVFHTRKKMLDIIRENISDKKQAGLAEALLIGYKEDLDKPLQQSYINTGIVHIIAVSGMHLGILYAMLMVCCRCLPRSWQRTIAPVIIISILWLFALLAAATPSVLRAAVMFTFLLIGNQLPHRSPPLNSLAASAFVLLWYDPWLIWDAGFQLSYAAMTGILLWQKPLNQLVSFDNRWLRQGWQLITATIAAQILTLPICLYYFHQFPNLFLLTNLVAVPLSTLILGGEIVLCLFHFIPPVAKVITYLVDGMIRLLNAFIGMVEQVPYAISSDISISLAQAIVLYGIIAGIAVWCTHAKRQGLLFSLAMLWICCLLEVDARLKAQRQLKLIVYNTPQYQAIDLIEGKSYIFIGDTLLRENAFLENQYLKPSRIAHRIRPVLPSPLPDVPLFRLGDLTGLIIDRPFSGAAPREKIRVDLLILSHNVPVDIQELINQFVCSKIVIDASNSPWNTRSWQQQCLRMGIPCHAVSTGGAFVLNLH